MLSSEIREDIPIDTVRSRYNDHLYMSGFVLQRLHSDFKGRKLTGKKRPGWKRVFMELRGQSIYRWEAGSVFSVTESSIEAIKSGNIDTSGRQLEEFPIIDLIMTEFYWIGVHRAHTELRHLTVIEGICGGDKTYWNFGNDRFFQEWRTQIWQSRRHRSLILMKNLVAEPQPQIDGRDSYMVQLEWPGGDLFDQCRIKKSKDVISIRSHQGHYIKICRITSLNLTTDSCVELLGKFKSTKMRPEKVHLIRLKITDARSLADFLLKRPVLDDFNRYVQMARKEEMEAVKPRTKCNLPWMNPIPPRQTQMRFNVTNEYDLEQIFYGMLPILVEEGPFDMVPETIFYQAILTALRFLGIEMVPGEVRLREWMEGQAYRLVKYERKDHWLGFRLKPINYELYRRRSQNP